MRKLNIDLASKSASSFDVSSELNKVLATPSRRIDRRNVSAMNREEMCKSAQLPVKVWSTNKHIPDLKVLQSPSPILPSSQNKKRFMADLSTPRDIKTTNSNDPEFDKFEQQRRISQQSRDHNPKLQKSIEAKFSVLDNYPFKPKSPQLSKILRDQVNKEYVVLVSNNLSLT